MHETPPSSALESVRTFCRYWQVLCTGVFTGWLLSYWWPAQGDAVFGLKVTILTGAVLLVGALPRASLEIVGVIKQFRRAQHR